jgi:hypothetical protein
VNRQQEREIKTLLQASGLPWEIKRGKKHRQIVVAGAIVSRVPIVCRGNETGHQHKNVVAAVRRIIRSRSDV